MDAETLGAAIAIAKKMPGTAAEAAERAEEAAALAQTYGYYLEFGDNETIIVGSAED